MRLFAVAALATAASAFVDDFFSGPVDKNMLDWFTYEDFMALATKLDEDG